MSHLQTKRESVYRRIGNRILKVYWFCYGVLSVVGRIGYKIIATAVVIGFVTALVNIAVLVFKYGGSLPLIVFGTGTFAYTLLAIYPDRHRFGNQYVRWRARRELRYALKVQALIEATPGADSPSPPNFAEFLLVLCGPRNDFGDSMVGCFAEKFTHDCQSYGYRRASNLYWAETLRSLFPAFCAKIRSWGLFAMLLEYGRRLIGL
jgi:hypothetical protein